MCNARRITASPVMGSLKVWACMLKALDIDQGQQPSVNVHQIRLGCHDLQDQGSAPCGQGMPLHKAHGMSGLLWVMMPEAARSCAGSVVNRMPAYALPLSGLRCLAWLVLHVKAAAGEEEHSLPRPG